MMTPPAGSKAMLLLLLSSPLLMLLVHAVAARVLRRSSNQATALKAVLFSYVPLCALLWFLVFRSISSFRETCVVAFYCFLVYSSLAYTYFHFFNMSETARRIRILHEIHRAGSLPLDKMTALYKTADLISIRLKRLVALGQLRYSDGYYSIEGKTLYLAGMLILFWRKLLGFDRGFGKSSESDLIDCSTLGDDIDESDP